MLIKDATINYSKSREGSARLTLTLAVEEDDPGSAILWANQVIDGWTANKEPLELTEELAPVKEAAAAPQENPTPTPVPATQNVVSTPTAPVAGPVNPFAIGAPAAPAANPTTVSSAAAEPNQIGTGDAPSAGETAPTVEITDNDMHAAAHLAVERKVPATAIKRITAKYAGASLSMRDIPQDKRPLWLKEVKELRQA